MSTVLCAAVLSAQSSSSPSVALPAVTAVVQTARPAVVSIAGPKGSLGSGFVIRADGLVMTSRHLLQSSPLTITLADGATASADIIATHPDADLALLRVAVKRSLPALARGDSRRLEVGEWVVAIGNPFGLGVTASAGIVGAVGRTLGRPQELIQTDAAINPGNSGGPLCNMRGEAIAVVSAAITAGQGIGFAVPIHLADSLLAAAADKAGRQVGR